VELLFLWVMLGIISTVVAVQKGKSGCLWFGLGFLLGPLGLVLALLIPKNEAVVEAEALESGTRKKCPFCAEIIKAEATRCRFCSSDLPGNPPETSDPAA
jgi:hypothetical protein